MAQLNFITQGLVFGENHLNSIQSLFKLKDLEGVLFSTAYLREGAIEALALEIKKYSKKLKCFVGIRNGVTSKQALKALFDAGAEIYVVDTGMLTTIFHAKNYLSYNSQVAKVIVGSGNLTPSGLARNIENSIEVTLDLSKDDEKLFLDKILNYYKTLSKEHPRNVLHISNEEELDELFLEGVIVDEDTESEVKEIGRNSKEIQKSLRPAMKLKITNIPRRKKRRSVSVNKAKITVKNEEEILNLEEVWKSKPLVRRDINLPANSNSHATGSMLLKKGEYDINQQTYFRTDVFSMLDWDNQPNIDNQIEFAYADFIFIINGVNQGTVNLKIKHDNRTDTATYMQKQPMTTLYWGDAKPLISDENLLDKVMKLNKVQDSSDMFVIDIE